MAASWRHTAAFLWACLAATCSPAQKTPSNTITVNTRLIYVDVVVRDDYGHPAHGLTQADFAVKEDGRPQQIVFFQDSDTVRATLVAPSVASKSTATTTAPRNAEFSNVAPTTITDPSANLILLDLLNTPVTDQLYAIQQLIKFCKKLPPGHRVALFLLTNRLHVLQGLTGSSDQLIAAANKISGKDLLLTNSRDEQMQMADFITTFANAIGPDPGGAAGALKAELDTEQGEALAQRFRITADAFAQIARAVSGYPGRKNLMWLAENFPVGVGAQLQIDRSNQGLDVRNTASLVANLQIALYPISLAGLQVEGAGAAANGSGEVSLIGSPTGTTQNPSANDTLRDEFATRNAMYYAMNDLAHDTGGEAFHGTNDIAGAMDRVLDDGSQFYTLAYRPSNTNWNGQLREIRVALAKHGYHLSYRRGYLATPQADGTRNADVELAATMQPGTLDTTLLRLRADVAEIPSNHHLALAVTLDASDLSFRTDTAGHRHTQLLVQLIALPTPGTTAKATPPPQTQTVLNLDLDPTQYADLLRSGLHFREQLPATFANRDLRLGIAETETHHIGTLTMNLAQPAVR